MSSIQFNGKIINIMLPSKVCINFYTQVFNTFGRIQSFTTLFYFKITFKFLLLRFKDYHFSFFSEILFAFNKLTGCFKSALTSLFSFLIELLQHNRLWKKNKFSFLEERKLKLCRTNRKGNFSFSDSATYFFDAWLSCTQI